MAWKHGNSTRIVAGVAAGIILAMAMASFNGCSSTPPLEIWHTEKLNEEFTAELLNGEVSKFNEYIKLEDKLFKQLDIKIYAQTDTGPSQALSPTTVGLVRPNWSVRMLQV